MTLPIAVAAAHAQEEPADFRGYVDQARFFLKKEWYADAAEQLEAAVATPDGKLDPEAWFLLAGVRYELADLDGARVAADRALVNSRQESQTQQAADLLAYLTEQFGYITLEPPQPGMASRVDIELQTVIFDPKLKEYFNTLLSRLERPVALPITVGLPAGTYLVNGETVEVSAGGSSQMEATIRGGAGGLGAVALEFGVGVEAWFGSSTSAFVPAPVATAAVAFPVGPLVFGGLASWSYQAWEGRDGALLGSPAAWSAGARVGVELPGTEPLVIRPSVGWRYQQLPGIELGCASEEAAYTCAVMPGPDVRELYVYAPASAQVPFVELAAKYSDRTRKSGLGMGVAVTGAWAFGRVPDNGEAASLVDSSFTWSATDRAWSAFGVRASAQLSYDL